MEGGGCEEVAFLVRPGRKAALERDGLAIDSPHGNFRGPVRAVLSEEAGTDWDIALLSCKAYDLDGAIATLRPALGPRTGVVPLLNGMTHLETLQAAFGRARVLGGLARIFAALTPEEYRVLRQHGTERSGSSPLDREKRHGTFVCAGCGNALFDSAAKFNSGTGWPSFFQPLEGAVGTAADRSLFMTRTEVHCARCGGHLGHVFPDGPPPTGQRFCMNGVAMRFEPAGD